MTNNETVLKLAADYRIDNIGQTWNALQQEKRQAWSSANPNASYDANPVPYSYVQETWTNYIIVQSDSYPGPTNLQKIPYDVDKDGNVTFGDPEDVKVEYVAASRHEQALDQLVSLANRNQRHSYKRPMTEDGKAVSGYQPCTLCSKGPAAAVHGAVPSGPPDPSVVTS